MDSLCYQTQIYNKTKKLRYVTNSTEREKEVHVKLITILLYML